MAANPIRNEVWLVDLGMVAKVRPCLVLSITADEETDRVLTTVVPHTTSTREPRFEVLSNVGFLKSGAFDYVIKPIEEGRLLTAVRRGIAFRELKQENLALRQHILSDTLEKPEVFAEIITNNKKMLSILHYIDPVTTITGMSGSSLLIIPSSSSPSMFGIVKSRSTVATCCLERSFMTSLLSRQVMVLFIPAIRKVVSIASRICSSSSTIMTGY